jgi:hypothetical protein
VLTTRQLTALYLAAAAALFGIIGAGALVVPLQLHQAVTRQCLDRDWPTAKADVHEAWCLDNGYKVGR